MRKPLRTKCPACGQDLIGGTWLLLEDARAEHYARELDDLDRKVQRLIGGAALGVKHMGGYVKEDPDAGR